MDIKLFQAREQHGEAFALVLPNGDVVPWKPLSVGDFLKYTELTNSGRYPPALIEDEIFSKCVLDEFMVKNRDSLNAGIVSTVAQAIVGTSGPHSFDDLRALQGMGRIKANELAHELVGHITQAFPAYKPEDCYAMDFETFMLRLGMAERKLLRLGVLTEPIALTVEGEEPQQQKQAPQPPPMLPLGDMKQNFDQQNAPPERKRPPRPQPPQVPIERTAQEQTIISQKHMPGGEFLSGGHDMQDAVLLESGMVDETRHIFEHYQKDLDDGKKLVIKTVEERKAAFKERAEHLEGMFNVAAKELGKRNKKMLEEVEEAKKKRKATKRRRRR